MGISYDRRKRERAVEQFIRNSGMNIMNDGAPTRMSYNVETAIDLLLYSAGVEADLQWSIDSSAGDSDHCPIFIHYEEVRRMPRQQGMTNWKVKDALWDIYATSEAWNTIPEQETGNCEEAVKDVYERIERASLEAIPVGRWNKYFPKPWWSKKLKLSKIRRERQYQGYRRNETYENMIAWNKSRAKRKALVRKSKREAGVEFVEQLQQGAPASVIYQTIRRIKEQVTVQDQHVKRRQ